MLRPYPTEELGRLALSHGSDESVGARSAEARSGCPEVARWRARGFVCWPYGHGSKSKSYASEHPNPTTKIDENGLCTNPTMVPLALTHSNMCLE